MTNKLALSPCPFCGGPADFEECKQGSSVDPKSCTWSVGCNNSEIDCIGYQMLASFDRKCEAAEAWNKRAERSIEVDDLNFLKAFWRAAPSCLDLRCNADCNPMTTHCGRAAEVNERHNARK